MPWTTAPFAGVSACWMNCARGAVRDCISKGTNSKDPHEEVAMDLDHLSDEDLVRRAQQDQNHEALEALALRCWGSITGWIAQAALLLEVPAQDVRDAQQQMFSAFLHALRLFDPEQVGRTRRCRFRSFLHRQIMRSFKD